MINGEFSNIPKTIHKERMTENLNIYDFTLSEKGDGGNHCHGSWTLARKVLTTVAFCTGQATEQRKNSMTKNGRDRNWG